MFHVGPYGEHEKNCPNVEYLKGQKAPSWKEHHKKARFSWTKKYVSFGENVEWCCIYRREKMEFRWSWWVPLLLARPKERKKGFPDFLTSLIMACLFLGLSFFLPTLKLLGCFGLISYVIIHCTHWTVDFLGDFLLRMPIFFKSHDHSFLVISKRIATSHDLFLIFIVNFYIKITLNIKIVSKFVLFNKFIGGLIFLQNANFNIFWNNNQRK